MSEFTQPEFIDIEITSEYGYNLEGIQETLTNNILHMRALFESADFLSSELELIGEEFVSTATKFAQAQGLGGGGTSLLAWGSTPKNKFGTVTGPQALKGIVSQKGPTGNLINHIKYQIIGGNKDIVFYNDAQNSRNQYYAGHIEYGFHDRGGGLVPARPFMRPALYAVADASRGRIQRTMKAYLEQMWAMESLKFGYPVTPKGNYRKFYQLHENPSAKGYGKYTSSGLPKGRIRESTSMKQRMAATVNRSGKNNQKYTQAVSSRMGSKGGWYKGYSGRAIYDSKKGWTREYSNSDAYKRDTTWKTGPQKTSPKQTVTRPTRTHLPQSKGYHNYISTDGQTHNSYAKAERASYNYNKQMTVKKVEVPGYRLGYKKSGR